MPKKPLSPVKDKGQLQSDHRLVFMESEHRRFCEKWLEPARQRIEAWEIEVVGQVAAIEIASKVQRTFRLIRQRTDELLTTLGLANPTP